MSVQLKQNKSKLEHPPPKTALLSLTYSPSAVHAITSLLTSVPLFFFICISLKTFSLPQYLPWCLL